MAKLIDNSSNILKKILEPDSVETAEVTVRNFTYQNLQTKIIYTILMKYFANTSSFFQVLFSIFYFPDKYASHQRTLENISGIDYSTFSAV